MAVTCARREGRYCPTRLEAGQTRCRQAHSATYTFLTHLPCRRTPRRPAAHDSRIFAAARSLASKTPGRRRRTRCARSLWS